MEKNSEKKNNKKEGVIEKIRQDKEVCEYVKNIYGWMLALSILALGFTFSKTIEAFENEIDWVDIAILFLMDIYTLVNLIETIANIKKLNVENKRKL